MRVLLVEDETAIASFIEDGLTKEGYAVDWIENGCDGFAYASMADYDLLILDIMLPGMDGLQLLRKIRSCGMETPALMLTARDTVRDRVDGLDAGADDYLVKPFAFPELLARLRALLRRPPLQAEPILKVGDLEMDIAQRRVNRRGQPIQLRPREFAVLEYMMRNANYVLTRSQIGEHVWNLDFYSESNVVDVYIGFLRRKIDKNHEPKLLHTIRGVGYCLSAEARHD